MPAPPAELPAVVREKLAAFAARQRRVSLLRGLAEAAAAFALATVVGALLTWAVHPPFPIRLLLSATVYLGALAVLWRRGVGHVAGKARLSKVARQFEQAAGGQLRERLMSAVELAERQPPGTSAWMARRTIFLAAREVGPLEPAALVDARPMRQAGKAALLGLLLLAGASWFAGPYVKSVLNPFVAPVAAGFPGIQVWPGDWRLKSGESLEIAASAQPKPESVTLQLQWADGFKEQLPMSESPETNGYARRLSAITVGFRYQVKAGELASPQYEVTVESPPKLEGVNLQVTPPGYTGWPVRDVPSGDADVLEGSRVKVIARLSGEEPQTVELLANGAAPQPMTLRSNVATLEFSPTTNLTYGFRLAGANGLIAEPSDRWTLRVLPDAPPTASLLVRGLEAKAVGGDELLLLSATAHDDVGLKSLELAVACSSTNTFRQSLAWTNRPSEYDSGQSAEASLSLNLAERNLEPGDEVELRLEAADLSGRTGASDPVQFTILKPEAAEAAQFALRLRQRLHQADTVVESFRQTRAHWLGWVSSFAADPAGAAAEARLLHQRLDQLRDELAGLGTNIFEDSGRTKLPIAPYLVGLAGEVSGWGLAQHGMLNGAVSNIIAAAPARLTEAVAQGRDLFDHATTELARLRAQVALAPVALEAEAMAARTESAQGRYKRSLPVARAALGWDSNQQIGLLASYYAGKDLAGAPALQQVAVPSFDNFEVPKLGRENWSARFQGELNVPEAGKWDFACAANDGVRLLLDETNLLPPEAWAAQGAREHKASRQLAAGWHPLTIEFFQASGRNQLHLRLGKEGAPLLEVAAANLRTRLPAPAQGPTSIAGLTPAALQAATNRMVQSFGSVARVSGELAAMTNDVPHAELIKLADRKAPTGPALQTNLVRLREWGAGDSGLAEFQGDDLTAAARDANRIVQDLVNQARHRWRGAPELQAVRLAIEQVRATANEMRPLAWNNKNRDELIARKPQEFTAANAWAGQLEQSTHALARQLAADARNRQSSLAARATALKASLRLEPEAIQSAQAIEQALQTAPTAAEMLGKVDRELEKIENLLNEAVQAADAKHTSAVAQLARAGLFQARAQDQDALTSTVDNIATAERRHDDRSQAEALEKAAAQPDGKELRSRLRELAQHQWDSPPSLGNLIPPPMHSDVSALQQSPDAKSQVAEDLARPRLGLALEAERLRRENALKPAVAYGLLGRDLGEVIVPSDRLSAPTLKPLADRASALAGQSGGPAREAEIASAWERWSQMASQTPPNQADSVAARLDELALTANEAAGNQAKRPALMNGLDEFSALEPGQGPETELAAEAATEAKTGIAAAPSQGEPYREAGRTLSAAAAEVRLLQAGSQAAAAEAAAAGQAALAQTGQQTQPAPHAGGPADRPREGDYNRPVGSAAGLDHPVAGDEQASWARLREKLREAVRATGLEHFTEEQQEAIRAYFKRLAAEK